MKIKTMVSAIMAMSLATSGFAFAQGNDRGRNDQRGAEQDRRDGGDRANNQNRANNQGRANVNSRFYSDNQRDERGAGPNHSYHRGDRLSAEERHRQYVVNDWRGHNLSAPPRGYQYVQSGSDFLLVAIATGIIANLVLR